MTSFTPAPKPKRAPPKKPQFSSIIDKRSHAEKLAAALKLRSSQHPIKKRSKKRDRNDATRIYGPPPFVTFLHAHACLGCGYSGRVEQAHRFTGGMGRKGRWQDSIPLCGRRLIGGLYPVVLGCHHHYDRAKQSWSRDHNLPARAAQFWTRWLLEAGRLGICPLTGKAVGRGGE